MQATMQERNREVLTPQPNQPPLSSGERKIALRPEEGWSTFILLGFVIYSAVWSIQAVDWVNGLGILSWTTGLGLALGFIAAKQNKIARLLMHVIVMVVGIFLAFWLTAAAYNASIGALWDHFILWLDKAITPNTNTNDDVMFLLFLAVLSFILAYVSVWLVARTRRPWLVALATGIVLLINLSYAPDANLIYLTVFLLAGLLLLVRFNLSEAYRQWRRRALRYTADLGWDFMVAGMLFSVGILIFGWLLPTAGTNATFAGIWNGASNPWVAAQQLWERLFQVQGGPGYGAYFSNQLQLTGSVNLPNYTVLTYTSTSKVPGQYLLAVTQDYFDGHIWSSTGNTTRNFDARQTLPEDKTLYTVVQQNIHLVNPPGGNPNQFIFAEADPASFSVPVGTTQDVSGYTSYYARGPLVGGQNYTATSYISTADEDTLRQVPLPADAQGSSDYFYPQDLVLRYTQVPGDLQTNQEVHALAQAWTTGQTNMYDMAQALADHLRSGEYRYSLHNENPPGNQDAVAWFLTQSKQGFCTYFASAMVILARMLGMPARVASGYTNGTVDANGNWVVKGTDAHTWAQIYFAQYGWVNFEPSAGFSSVARPIASLTPTSTNTTGQNTSPVAKPTPKDPSLDFPGGSTSPSTQAGQNDLHMRLLLGAGGLLALLILLFGAASIWWRRLFRGLSPVAQTFGRVTVLAGWAGLKPRRTQTPFEYIGELQQHLPVQADSLQRLGELYVQERWGASEESPGVLEELRQLWGRLRRDLVRKVLRRPSLNPLVWIRLFASRRRRRVK
jgi:transglutaminase-like putative cysteine protease